ncbi:hypothetical protein EVAR_92117_1 [Eumeta japonica]|uniref:Uncharacterized protein n=1 Tax=Eumeta variegata TaxID=151549 RepID=A0A4C1SYF8_EUMVA|nr:hypothetical protein EVAR_92117_1 [Eumeta japonica]
MFCSSGKKSPLYQPAMSPHLVSVRPGSCGAPVYEFGPAPRASARSERRPPRVPLAADRFCKQTHLLSAILATGKWPAPETYSVLHILRDSTRIIFFFANYLLNKDIDLYKDSRACVACVVRAVDSSRVQAPRESARAVRAPAILT